MFTASYPATFLREEEGRGYHVRFRDLPEALTGGDDKEDTIRQARDCFGGGDCGADPARGGDSGVEWGEAGSAADWGTAAVGAKAGLYLAVRERGMAKTELRRWLGVSETVVRGMLAEACDEAGED